MKSLFFSTIYSEILVHVYASQAMLVEQETILDIINRRIYYIKLIFKWGV